MNALISEEVWSSTGMNYGKIKEKYPNEIGACMAFITGKRGLSKTEMSIFGETIGQLCVDSRVKLKKKKDKEEKAKPKSRRSSDASLIEEIITNNDQDDETSSIISSD